MEPFARKAKLLVVEDAVDVELVACSSGLEVSGGSVTGSQDPIVDHDNDSDKVESQQGGSSEPDSAARPYGAVVDVLAPL